VPSFDEQSGVFDPNLGVTGALHDVSNALTVLLGWVSEARAAGASPEAVEHALGMVEQRARVARDLARRAIGAGPSVLAREDDLDAIVVDALDALAVESQHAEVRLAQLGAGGGGRVRGADDISQILTNLVMNALAYAPRGSQITVEAKTQDRLLVLEVADEGPGIEPARASSVFRGDSTREGGTGVGLRHARAVARAAGGNLVLVRGAARQRGARFRLTWPRADTLAPAPPMSKPASPVLQGQRVLILEDDADVAILLETALGARGAHITLATTAEELASAAKDVHDAALIDLSPIATDVQGAIDELRRGSPDLALVFISGSAVGIPELLTTSGARWVRKPFEIAEVLAALTESRTKR
jgi:CheY-like chemotaxis protein